ncbi:hypothetical protein ACHAWO_001889 [Cyclotella atomus]|jgi:hypothetical protein|uniref:ATP-grasp domain-containing protein n=1 Tax=Cyclotella atomus TaxID=382360 RepID=A0ABD3NID5_9STRA
MKLLEIVTQIILLSLPHAYKAVNGLIDRPRRPAFARSSVLTHNSLTFLTAALQSRGGAHDESTTNIAIDDANDSIAVHSDEMQQLRQQWSSVPAIPSISWPFDIELAHDETHKEHIQQQKQKPIKAIIIMDGFSPYHGQYLDQAAHHLYGAAVIHILSDFMTRFMYQVEKETDHLSSRMPDLDNAQEVEAWKNLIPSNMEVCGIYCESDSGLDDAEKLGVALGLYPRCHDGVNEARRNKYLTNQMVQDAGLDTVKQKSCKSLKEAEEFATTLGLEDGAENASTMVVVKPLRGVASDDVHLCSDMASLRAAFNKIYQSAVFGSATSSKHENVLVQEFATGTEYAIDVVCKDGERKVAALWKYDKRAVNDAPFVYFSTQLVAAVGEDVEQAVCEYVFNALDALGIRWGLHHVEVIVEKTSTDTIRVRLVEVNCRQHNTDFRPLTNAVVGYNALDMTLTAYLGDGSDSQQNKHQYPLETEHLRLKWNTLPTLPSTLAYGAIVHFVSFVEGTISRIRFDILNEMEELDSVMDMEVYPQFLEVGNEIEKTKDIRTDTGWAHIMNDDKIKFQADYQRLVELMAEMFEVE